MKLCGLAILAAPALLAGCGLGSNPLAPAGHPAPSGETESSFRGTSVGKRPAILTLARDGDPFPALAVAVRVAAGPRAAEGLAALIDARLSEAGVAADTRVARDGFHVRILLREASAERVVAALRDALLATVTDGPELRLAAARVLALRALVVDDDALSPIVACSQELRLTSLEAKVEGLTVTAASLEIARAAAVGDQTVAVGVVGPRDAVERVRAALASQPEWPSAAAAPRDWPNARSEGAYLLRERGGSRISVALRVPLRSAALGVAQRAVDPSSPLVARLRALPVPFLVRRVVATVHGSGACITVDAESELRAGTALTDATTAAAAALVVEHELLAELAEKTEDGTAAAQIRALADPREAAAAAANWALSQDATTQPTIPAFALGIPPRSGRDDPAAIAAAFSSSLAAGERAWARSAVDNRVAVEADQGQFWLLLASPCPLREGVPQAGLTTLTLEALTFSGVRHGVSVEPWIASDGFGLLAHAARLPGESGDALATRVADAAARLLTLDPPGGAAVLATRAAQLSAPESAGREQQARFATALLPEAPTAIFPRGSAGGVGRFIESDVRVRWGGFALAPLRAAVLANQGSPQATAALRAIDRWVPRTERLRACTGADDVKIGATPLAYPRDDARGLLSVFLVHAFDGRDPQTRPRAALLAAALNATGSPVAAAVAPQHRAFTTVRGRGAQSFLVIELSGAAGVGEATVAAARSALLQIATSALPPAVLTAGRARADGDEEARRLSPAERVIGLWRGEPVAARVSDAELAAFAASTLREDSLRVVRPSSAPESSK